MSWRSVILVILSLALGQLSHPALAQAQPRVAVLELKGKLSRGQLSVLSDKVRAGVLAGLRGKDYVVMSRENMAVLLKDMGLDCESVQGECEVETGRNIGAAYVVSGAVEDVGGGLLLVSLKVHDTASGALKATGDVRGKEVIQLIDQLPGTVAQVMARAFGEGGQMAPIVQQAPVAPGQPAQAQFNLNFGSGGGGLGVQAKLKEQECVRQADQRGSKARATRLADAIAQAKSKASQAWRAQSSELEMCTKLERSQRSGCISAVEQWLSVARSMKVDLPAGVETIQTDCGARQPAYQAESRMVAANEVSQAESLLRRLKASDVAPPPSPDSMILSRLGPRPVPLRSASSSQRTTLDKEWKGCRDGNASMCSDLGVSFGHGMGVSKSSTRAAELFRLGCDKGNMIGCKNLGIYYRDGKGVPQSHQTAVVLFRQSCDRGEAGGCSSLAIQYRKGQGVPESDSKANELYRKACEGKNTVGCYNLGVAYEFGQGVRVNKTTARSYYRKACGLGYQKACDDPLLK